MDLRVHKARTTLLYLILVGTLILSASLFVYSLISRHLLQVRSPTEAILMMLPFYEQQRIAGVRAAVLQSEQTARFFARSHEESAAQRRAHDGYMDLARVWRDHLLLNQIEVDLISDQDLLDNLYRYNMLIVPMAHCLSEDQVQAIKTFLSERKGVILTHMAGNRDEDGNERSWSLTGDITGGEPQYRFGRRHNERQLFLDSNTPLSAGIAPGFPLSVRTYDEPIELVVRERRVRQGGLWQATPNSVPSGDEDGTGLVYGEYMGGRFVWFGFSAQSLSPAPEMWDNFTRLMDNAIHWTTHRPIVGKAPWPSHHMAAAIGVMPQQNIAQAQDLHRMIADRGIRPGYFARPDDAPVNREALEQLRDEAEFGARITVLPTPTPQGIDTELVQSIQNTQSSLASQFQSPVPGISIAQPPYNGFDRLARLGVEYIWVHGKPGLIPKVAPLTRQPLFGSLKPPVLIHQAARSDQLLIEEQGLNNSDLLREMKDDVDRAAHFGGLYSITLNAHLIGSSRYTDVVRQWLSHLENRDVWLASPAEVAGWWRKQASITLRLVEGRRRLTVLISNEGNEPVRMVRVWIYPPRLPDSVDISVERIRTPIPDYRIDQEHERIELLITNLGRRENRTYYLDF